MTFLLAMVLATVLAAPGIATAQSLTDDQAEELRRVAVREHPAECSQLKRRIGHFKNMQQRAQILQHQQWIEKMGTQVSYLEGIQAARCPKDVAVDTTGRAINALLKLAQLCGVSAPLRALQAQGMGAIQQSIHPPESWPPSYTTAWVANPATS